MHFIDVCHTAMCMCSYVLVVQTPALDASYKTEEDEERAKQQVLKVAAAVSCVVCSLKNIC